LWAAVWVSWFRSNPSQQPGIAQAELGEIGDGGTKHLPQQFRWRELFSLKQLWLISIAYFCYAWGSWFYFGWFTTWLVRGAGFTVSQMSIFASFPFITGLLGNLVGGEVSERLVKRYGRKHTYRWVASICLVATACLMQAMSMAHDKVAIVVLATLGLGVMDLMLPAAWAMCMSIGGPYGGTATGVMNTAGNFGGWVGAVVFGYIVKATTDYNPPLRVIAAMVFIAALLFSRVDCTAGLQLDKSTSAAAS
jgi:predicted MFS family arabinose efflux permease